MVQRVEDLGLDGVEVVESAMTILNSLLVFAIILLFVLNFFTKFSQKEINPGA